MLSTTSTNAIIRGRDSASPLFMSLSTSLPVFSYPHLKEASTTQEDIPATTNRKCMVRFASTVRVRTLKLCLGDHPCCAAGMALACSDTVVEDGLIDLNQFEQASSKRPMEELRLDYAQRRQQLKEVTGWSTDQLEDMDLQRMEQELQQSLAQGQDDTDEDDDPLLYRSCRREQQHSSASCFDPQTDVQRLMKAST
jgi:hypothetical protein